MQACFSKEKGEALGELNSQSMLLSSIPEGRGKGQKAGKDRTETTC